MRRTAAGTPIVTTEDELTIIDENSATAATAGNADDADDFDKGEAAPDATKPSFTITDEDSATAAAVSEKDANYLWLLILAALAVVAAAGETARRVINAKRNNAK